MNPVGILVTVIASFIALVGYILSIYQYRKETLRLQLGIHLILGGNFFWTFFNLLARISPNYETALLAMKIGTLSVTFFYYGLFYHNRKFISLHKGRMIPHVIANITMGLNSYLVLFTDFVDVVKSPYDGLWYDNITDIVYVLLIAQAAYGAYWLLWAMVRTNLIGAMRSRNSRNLKLLIVSSVVILLSTVIMLIELLLSSPTYLGTRDSSGFFVISFFSSAFLAYAYGVRHLDDILVGVKIWSISVISEGGIPLLHFEDKGLVGTNKLMFASGLKILEYSASLILEKRSGILLIDTEEKKLILKKQGKVSIAVLVENYNIQSLMILEKVNEIIASQQELLYDTRFSLKPEAIERIRTSLNLRGNFS